MFNKSNEQKLIYTLDYYFKKAATNAKNNIEGADFIEPYMINKSISILYKHLNKNAQEFADISNIPITRVYKLIENSEDKAIMLYLKN